jgi:hypothetical protein
LTYLKTQIFVLALLIILVILDNQKIGLNIPVYHVDKTWKEIKLRPISFIIRIWFYLVAKLV